MRYDTTGDPASLDAHASHVWILIDLDPFWSTLVTYRSLDWTDAEIVGDLAERWTVSDDAMTYTFFLNPKARWQNLPPVNGRQVTAADVRWNYERRMDPTYPNKNVNVIAQLASVETPDDRTVVLKLKQPSSNFLNDEANSTQGFGMPILAREVYERDGSFAKTVVGSGPFIFKRWDPGTRLLFERNPNYWKTGTDGKPLPYLDGIEEVIIKDFQTEVAALRTGFLHFSMFGVDATDAGPLRGVKGLNAEKKHSLQVAYTYFNIARKPLDDVRVRRAFLKAIDMGQYKETIVGEPDALIESYIYTAITEFAYPQEKLRKLFTRDLPEARRLLAEAGYPKGIKLESWYPVNPRPTVLNLMTVLKQQWEEAGIQVNIIPGDSVSNSAKSLRGDYDLFYANAIQNMDPLSLLWSQTSFIRFNPWQWQNQRLDKLMLEAKKTLDKAKRRQIIEQAQDILWEELPAVLTPMPPKYQVQWEYLKGFKSQFKLGNPGLEFAWLDK